MLIGEPKTKMENQKSMMDHWDGESKTNDGEPKTKMENQKPKWRTKNHNGEPNLKPKWIIYKINVWEPKTKMENQKSMMDRWDGESKTNAGEPKTKMENQNGEPKTKMENQKS